MFKPRRLLAGAAVAVACTVIASACDSSPTAVQVGSQRIRQTRVNQYLSEYSGNEAFVKAYESQSQGASTVHGASASTYSSTFVAGVLDSLITSTALHQYLAAHHNLPGPRQIAAARGWESAVQGAYWLGFSPSFRDQMADDFADESQLATVSLKESELQGAVHAASGYLFTLVCVRQVGFTVTDPDGKPDYAASLAEARNATSGGHQLAGGAVTCYSPPRLETQGNPFYSEVVGAKIDQPIAPHRTAFGYQVIEVTHRNPLPFNEQMKKVTSLVAEQQTGNGSNAVLNRVITSARIWLNPQYGTWDPQKGVVPASPKVPSATP
ncbi:MAG: hypothetical protein FWC87_12375 [Acidimicrobiaceae bacterium]|nr:hypothetical protein [Acidimicrobiaceae bacterium]